MVRSSTRLQVNQRARYYTLSIHTFLPLTGDSHICKVLCHCLTCRKVTTSTYATLLLVPSSAFESPSTATPEYKTFTVQHETGLELVYSFCKNCGTICWKTGPKLPHHIIFVGTLEDQDALEKAKPNAEIWVKHRVSWVKSMEDIGVVQFDGFPPS